MHVLILNQTFYPDVAATAQLMWDLALHLEREGHRVTAIASRQIYGTSGQFDRAYEKIGGIEIHRVGGSAFGKKALAGRVADFLSFYVAAFWKMRQVERPDVILALTSPPMVAGLGALRKRFSGLWGGRPTRLVYHVMDLYPDAAEAMGVLRAGSMGAKLMGWLTRRTLEQSDAVIALGEDMAERIMKRYGRQLAAERIHVVAPWSDGSALKPMEKGANPMAEAMGIGGTYNIVYSGNLGMGHDVETLEQAIQIMREDAGTNWLFIGGGKRYEWLKGQAELQRWKHVRFLPYQERSALQESLNLADVHLISQLPEFTGVLVPSKLFGILAVGKPAVMVGPAEAEVSRVIARHKAGFVVPNGQGQELASRLRQLREDEGMRREMGQRARRAFEAEYEKEIACRRIEGILRGTVEEGR